MQDLSNLLPDNPLTGSCSMQEGNTVSDQSAAMGGAGTPSEATAGITPGTAFSPSQPHTAQVVNVPGDRPSVVDGNNSPDYGYAEKLSGDSPWGSDAQSGNAGGSDDLWSLVP
jgi:hypothetical protein